MDFQSSSTMLQEFLELLEQISSDWYAFNILPSVTNYSSKNECA